MARTLPEAAFAGKLEEVRQLLEHGADPDVEDIARSAIDRAANAKIRAFLTAANPPKGE